MEERMKKYCPICKEEKEFIRIVEAHIATEPFTSHTSIGRRLPQWVEKTVQPTAYCSNCKAVLYVGPSPDEVEKTFRKQEEVKRDARRRKSRERFMRQLGPQIRPN